MKSPVLDFYYFDACPYCQIVMRVIDKHNIKVNYMDIYGNLNYLQKLTLITGRKTVPCLFIDGDPMHESMDIINWIELNLDHLTKK